MLIEIFRFLLPLNFFILRLDCGGGGGSSAPPPDPRLIEAQIKSMGIQDSAISQIMQNAADLAPLQKQQLQFGLDTAKTAYDQSQEDRTWALGRRDKLTQAQDTFANRVDEFDSSAHREQMADQAQADVDVGFSSARDQQGRAMARMGINPASGRAQAADNQLSISQAAAKAGAANKTRMAATEMGFQLQGKKADMLSGYPTLASGLTTSGAGIGSSGLTIANTGLAGLNSGSTSAASVAGSMGANAATMYGTMGSYKTAADKVANDDGGVMGALGMLGGAAITKYSDRRLKDNIILVGQDEATGLNLYEFNYTHDPDVRFRGVMADEVEKYMPDAVMRDGDGYLSVDYDMIGIEIVEV